MDFCTQYIHAHIYIYIYTNWKEKKIEWTFSFIVTKADSVWKPDSDVADVRFHCLSDGIAPGLL